MSDGWILLKNRYSSNSSYNHRKVIENKEDFEDFQDYLISTCNAEILAQPKQDEALRFKMPDGNLGIVYGRGSGNLTAHNLGLRYSRDNGIDLPADYHNATNYRWHVPVKNSQQCSSTKDAIAYEYCYGCKEVQPLIGDQCAVCYCYIKF